MDSFIWFQFCAEIARNAGLAPSQKLSADQRKRIAALGGKASAGKPKTK